MGLSQARILQWAAISFSKGSSPPRDGTCVSCTGRWILYHWATREAPSLKKKIIWIDGETFCIKFLFYVCVLGRVWLFVIPWSVAFQAPLSMGFFRQEFWSRLSFPPPGDLPDLGIKPMYLMSPALVGRFFTTVTHGKPSFSIENGNYFKLVYLSQSEILLWFMIRVLKSWLSCEHEILNIQYVSEISWVELKAEQMQSIYDIIKT